jgi:RimJ/RimL family protein N-acetyltransferase
MRIRPYQSSDFEAVKSWITTEQQHTWWCADRLPRNFSRAEFEQKMKEEEQTKGQSAFTATLSDGTPVGFFCMGMDYGDNSGFLCYIVVDAKKRGKGYGREMVSLALQYAFTILGFDKVRLYVFSENEVAKKAYAKAGFYEEAELSEPFFHHGVQIRRIQLRADNTFRVKM